MLARVGGAGSTSIEFQRDQDAPKRPGPSAVSKGQAKEKSGPTVRSKPGNVELGVSAAEKAKEADATKPNIRTGPPSAKRVEFWKDFYAKRKDTPGDVKETVQLLRFNGDMTDVEAVLGGYLYSRPDQAEPWMFGTLATTIELNKGGSDRVKGWLDYCATLAEKSGNPNHLVEAADQLLLRGYNARVGTLLDEAAEKIPHSGVPLRMMLLLARQTSDPDRMASTGEKLLELGWPGVDEAIRHEVRIEATALAKLLRAKDRENEASQLLARIAAAEPRDLIVRVTWAGDADLDLAVEDPLGATTSLASPRTVFGGALIKNGRGQAPEEIYVCPRGFDGAYVIRVEPIYNDPDRPVERATVEATLNEGTPKERKQTWTVALNRPEPIVVTLEGGRRKKVLDFVAPGGVPQPDKAPRLRPGPLLKPALSPLIPKPSLPRIPTDAGGGRPR